MSEEDYGDTCEWCPECGAENEDIPPGQIAVCYHCGAVLLPCSMCEPDLGCESPTGEGCRAFPR